MFTMYYTINIAKLLMHTLYRIATGLKYHLRAEHVVVGLQIIGLFLYLSVFYYFLQSLNVSPLIPNYSLYHLSSISVVLPSLNEGSGHEPVMRVSNTQKMESVKTQGCKPRRFKCTVEMFLKHEANLVCGS